MSALCQIADAQRAQTPLDTPLLPWLISRTGVRSHSDRVSARFFGRPPGEAPAKCQTACATVSAASSEVSGFCNTRAQGHDVYRGRVQDAIDQVSKSLQRVRLLVVVAMPIVVRWHNWLRKLRTSP